MTLVILWVSGLTREQLHHAVLYETTIFSARSYNSRGAQDDTFSRMPSAPRHLDLEKACEGVRSTDLPMSLNSTWSRTSLLSLVRLSGISRMRLQHWGIHNGSERKCAGRFRRHGDQWYMDALCKYECGSTAVVTTLNLSTSPITISNAPDVTRDRQWTDSRPQP